jgi:Putative transposase
VPFPLRFPLAFDGKLVGQVVRIFADTVAGWYRRRHVDRGLPPGETGAVTVIQRANSDLRLNPHLHTIFLDGVYSPDSDGKGQMFHHAPAPTQDEVEALVGRVSMRILRFLQRRGVITIVAATGDGEVTVIADETLGEKDYGWGEFLSALKDVSDGGFSFADPLGQEGRTVHDLDVRATLAGNGAGEERLPCAGRAGEDDGARARCALGRVWRARRGSFDSIGLQPRSPFELRLSMV